MMSQENKTALHYLILGIVLTFTVFIAHWLSGILRIEPLVNIGFFGWLILFVWYLLFILLSLVLLDPFLHRIMDLD